MADDAARDHDRPHRDAHATREPAAKASLDIPSVVFRCMQCRKCTVGCPVADSTDLPIGEVMGWLRTGDLGRALSARALWDCVGCHACSTRCPSGADPAEVLDTLRLMAVAAGCAPSPRARTFHKAFLKYVRSKGRADEVGLMMRVYLRHGFRRGDIAKGLAMYRKGRIRVSGKKIENRREVKRIFGLGPSSGRGAKAGK